MNIYVSDDKEESVITFKDEDGVIQIIRGKKVDKREIKNGSKKTTSKL